jgi:thiamine pyrophosphate-dependent acetolactate synthase large subunit-like protein
MVRDVQTMAYKGRYVSSEFVSPDFVKLADSFGALGLSAEKPGEVADAVREAFASDRPAVVAVPIDATEMPPSRARMLAMDRSLGNPPLMQSLSLGALKTIWGMLRER